MSVIDCIRKLSDDGVISKDKAVEVEQLITDEVKSRAGNSALDVQEAADIVFQRIRENKDIKKYQKLKQIETNIARYERIKNAPDIGTARETSAPVFLASRNKYIRAVEALYDRDVFDAAPQNNVTYRSEAVHKYLHSHFDANIAQYAPSLVRTLKQAKRKVTGTPLAEEKDIADALYGKTDNEAAHAVVSSWRDAVEEANRLYRKAGGALPNMKDWDLPHVWDNERVRQSSFDDFYNTVRPKLDDAKMKSIMEHGKGSAVLDFDKEIRVFLEEVKNSIDTHGLNKHRDFGAYKTKTKFANKYDTTRFLHFKEGEWVNVNNKFGQHDIFTSMQLHLRNIANDIALMEILGPDIEAGFRHSKDVAEHFIKQSSDNKTVNAKVDNLKYLDAFHAHATGMGSIPTNSTIAKGASTWRQLITSAWLGSAVIPAVGGDLLTNTMTAHFNGAPITKQLKQYVEYIAKSEDAMEDAADMGLLGDMFSGSNLAALRMADQIMDSNSVAMLGDASLRATGLSLVTEAGRTTTAAAIHLNLGNKAKLNFADLDSATRSFLERYGLDSDAWDKVRTHGIADYHGRKMFNSKSLIDAARNNNDDSLYDIAIALEQGIVTERSFGTITSSPRTEARLLGESSAGSVHGEGRRSFAMFKRFPITVIHTHLARYVASNQINWKKRSSYLGVFAVALTLNGMVAEQLNHIANGREPVEWDSNLLMKGAVRGGAMGIVADAIGKVHNGRRTLDSADIMSFVLGPMVSQPVELGRSLFAPAFSDKDNKAGQLAGNITNFAGRNTPFLSSAFYTKLLFRRLITEQLEMFFNPNASRRHSKTVKRNRKEGRKFWWKPGQAKPS
ncbi:hypothetical protein V5T82_14225 [Magnetovibrio sp. PR-2]|uniref:hypothetical protein n=1 Tax=Magnetovibrio sp. PR-2 TaxID=3120356 RepID=UPI002FCDEBE5